MEDMKIHMKICGDKLEASLANPNKLGALHHISTDKAHWETLFTYNAKRSALENFLLYKAAIEFDLYDDCANHVDMTQPILADLKRRLDLVPNVVSVKIGKEIKENEKHRAFLVTLDSGKTLYLESDTAYSLMNDLGNYLRPLIKRMRTGKAWPRATYLNDANLVENSKELNYKPLLYYYFYNIIPALHKRLKDEVEKNCFDALEERAGLTHVLSNMMLVPYGYNAKRSLKLKTYSTNAKIADRLDLTFTDFKEMLDDPSFGDTEFQARLGNKKCTVDSVRFLMNNKKSLFPSSPSGSSPITDNSVVAILQRSESIIASLSEHPAR